MAGGSKPFTVTEAPSGIPFFQVLVVKPPVHAWSCNWLAFPGDYFLIQEFVTEAWRSCVELHNGYHCLM